MRLGSKLLLAGLGTLALAGVAAAADQKMHLLEVRLPDGSVEHIRYTGNVPPRIVFVPIRQVRVPGLLADEVSADPFPSFGRIFAEMNRRTDAIMRRAAAMTAQARPAPGQARTIAAGSMPPGAVRYSSFSVTTPKGTCSRSVQITSQGEGKPAKVVTQTSGDCGAAPAAPQKPAAPASKGAKSAPSTATPEDARDTI